MNQSLYAVYLGGKAFGAHIEVHDVVFLVSSDIHQDYQQIKSLWFGDPSSVHIDAIATIYGVDGYKVVVQDFEFETELSEDTFENHLYFINFGAAAPGQLSELHQSGFFIAKNRAEAIAKAKEQFLPGAQDVHLDNFYDVDDCIQIQDHVPYKILLTKEPGFEVNVESLYKKL